MNDARLIITSLGCMAFVFLILGIIILTMGKIEGIGAIIFSVMLTTLLSLFLRWGGWKPVQTKKEKK